MGRQRLPAAERREQILHAALRCFAKHNYRGATTKRIAREAGVAEALIYRYFGSKQLLFSEAVDKTAAFLLSGLEAAFQQHTEDPILALREVLALYAHALQRRQDLAKMIFVVSAELDDPVVRAAYLPHQKHALKLITHNLSLWQQRGLIRDDLSPHALAWLFFGTCQTLALMKHAGQLDALNLDDALQLARPFLKHALSEDTSAVKIK